MSVYLRMLDLLEARAIRIPTARIKRLATTLTRMVHKAALDSPRPFGKKQVATKQFPFKNAAGEHVQPYVILQSYPTNSKLYVKDLGAGIGRSPLVQDDIIFVRINGSIPQSEIKKATAGKGEVFRDQLYQALIHEFTHAAEPMRRKPGYKPGYKVSGGTNIPAVGEISAKDYYNDPDEVRAYLQEIIAELKQTMSKWTTLSKAFGPSQALKLLIQNSETWGRIEKHLTQKNRRYIIKAVATAIRDKS